MENNNQTINRFASLPSFVMDNIYEDHSLDAITRIRKEYLKNDTNQNEILKGVIGLTILKDIKIENIKEELEKDLQLGSEQSVAIALIVLTEIFYPIKDYFPGIEDEILKLGGEVPKEKPKKLVEQLLKREEVMEEIKRKEEAEERERMADTTVQGTIESLIKQFPVIEKQQIGNQESITIEDISIPMKPLIKYWLKDYRNKSSIYRNSNIERIKYVYHDKNTKNMNEEERRQLSLILKSIDDEILLPYSTKLKKIDFSKTIDL